MTIKLFIDFMSQPSRALYIFFKINKVPFELCPVALRKSVHLEESFKEKNRFQKVPFIHHNNFKLAESVAIVRYVAHAHNIDNHWYPKEIKSQARVDEYLEWQHTNTRMLCALYFWTTYILPLMTGEACPESTVEKHKANMIDCLDKIENIWLKDSKFLAGDKISVADLFGACEIEQPRMGGFDPREGRPILSAWLDRVRHEANPHYDEAHELVYKVLQKSAQKANKAKL